MGKEGVPQTIVEAVVKANLKTKQRMIERIVNVCDGILKDKIICILGITFKPNTDDMREAPSLTIVPKLLELERKLNF